MESRWKRSKAAKKGICLEAEKRRQKGGLTVCVFDEFSRCSRQQRPCIKKLLLAGEGLASPTAVNRRGLYTDHRIPCSCKLRCICSTCTSTWMMVQQRDPLELALISLADHHMAFAGGRQRASLPSGPLFLFDLSISLTFFMCPFQQRQFSSCNLIVNIVNCLSTLT